MNEVKQPISTQQEENEIESDTLEYEPIQGIFVSYF
jgi:hypothetical protein